MRFVKYLNSSVTPSFVEYCKPQLKLGESGVDEKTHVLSVLKFVLLSCISQLHPFLPFETEEINSILNPSFVPLLHQNYFTASSPLRVASVDNTLISEVEVMAAFSIHPQSYINVVHDVRSLQKLIGDMRKDKDESRVCYLLVNSGASNPSPGMVELVHRLSRLDIQLLTTTPQFSQIHMPSSIPGISVLFPVPEDRKSGVMKQIQDNMRGIEKKITQSEKKLEGIRRNLANPMFLTRASKEVCERERNDEKVVASNIEVLKKNLKDLESLLQFNHSRVSSNEQNQTSYFTFTGSRVRKACVSGRRITSSLLMQLSTKFAIWISRSFSAFEFRCDPRICIFFPGNFTAFSSFGSFFSIDW